MCAGLYGHPVYLLPKGLRFEHGGAISHGYATVSHRGIFAKIPSLLCHMYLK